MENKINQPQKDNALEAYLTPERMEEIGQAWNEMVLGRKKSGPVPTTQVDFKKWVSAGLHEESETLLKEWGLEPDQALIEKIKQAENPDEKAKLELDYISQSYDKIDAFVKEFKNDQERKFSRHSTMPLTMKRNKSFNCVGASLLGECVLSRAGIENYFGNPIGHVLNIARLSNGEWRYIDFLNGKNNFRKIEPSTKTQSGLQVLEIDDPAIDFRFIPLLEKDQVAATVINNLASLDYEATSDKVPDSPDKTAAHKYHAEFKGWFAKINFEQLGDALFPEKQEIMETDEMKQERKKVAAFRKAKEEADEYSQQLGLLRLTHLYGEAKPYAKDVREFLLTGEQRYLHSLSEEIKYIILLIDKGIEETEGEYPALRKEMAERVSAAMAKGI